MAPVASLRREGEAGPGSTGLRQGCVCASRALLPGTGAVTVAGCLPKPVAMLLAVTRRVVVCECGWRLAPLVLCLGRAVLCLGFRGDGRGLTSAAVGAAALSSAGGGAGAAGPAAALARPERAAVAEGRWPHHCPR